jgi:hypothetical protein
MKKKQTHIFIIFSFILLIHKVSIAQDQALQIAKPAQPARGLKLKSSLVPTLDLSKVKRLKDGTSIIQKFKLVKRHSLKPRIIP